MGLSPKKAGDETTASFCSFLSRPGRFEYRHAAALAAEGANVVISARTQSLLETAAELNAAGSGQVAAVVCGRHQVCGHRRSGRRKG